MLSAAAAAAFQRGASPLLRRPALVAGLPAGLRRGLAGAPPAPPAAPLPGISYVDRSPRVEAMYTSRPSLLKAYAAVVVVSTPLSLYVTA